MTLGQLKIDCIKKIKVDDNSALTDLTIDDYKEDREYKKYFNNIIPALNNGIRTLVLDEKIPFKSHEINITQSIKEITKETLSDVDDIYRIKSILYEGEDGNIMTVDYVEIAGSIKLGGTYSHGKLLILYAPRIRPLLDSDEDSLDLNTLGLNDLVCGYLTYFAKAELYEKVEPDEANKAKSYAEQYKAALDQEVTLPVQKKVRQVISLD